MSPIIDISTMSCVDFEQVQALLGKGRHYGKSNRRLAGKIKCGICGHAMPLIKGKEPYFTCGTKWYDSDYSCGDFRVSQVELYGVLATALQQQIDLQVEQVALRQVQAQKQAAQREKLQQRLAALQRELAQGKEQMRIQFEQFAAGALTEGDFSAFQQGYKGQVAQVNHKIVEIERQIGELREIGEGTGQIALTDGVRNGIILQNGTEVSLELLDRFICEVRVYPDGAVEIEWEFDKD